MEFYLHAFGFIITYLINRFTVPLNTPPGDCPKDLGLSNINVFHDYCDLIMVQNSMSDLTYIGPIY